MPADPDTLYGISRPQRKPDHIVSSSTSDAFNSRLTSLLSGSRGKDITGSGRSRSKQDIRVKKDDIFTAHRSKKRAIQQISKDDSGQIHQTSETIGGVDEEALKRSKRKMEEKARVYAAMKRGDYVDPKKHYINDEERGPLVDFDRKWADSQNVEGKSDSDASSDEEASDDDELVDFTDEFGRVRKVTKAQAARAERQRRIQTLAADELDDMSVRPKMPTNLIFGDTVQAAAFNPDAAIEKQMEELAARRNRSATPPEDTHYDATKEVRSKGTGFYQFSRDGDSRKTEMENLDQSRQQTEQWEEERRHNQEKKQRDMDESLRRDKQRESEREANAFLKTLGAGLEMFVPGGGNDNDSTYAKKKKKKGW